MKYRPPSRISSFIAFEGVAQFDVYAHEKTHQTLQFQFVRDGRWYWIDISKDKGKGSLVVHDSHPIKIGFTILRKSFDFETRLIGNVPERGYAGAPLPLLPKYAPEQPKWLVPINVTVNAPTDIGRTILTSPLQSSANFPNFATA